MTFSDLTTPNNHTVCKFWVTTSAAWNLLKSHTSQNIPYTSQESSLKCHIKGEGFLKVTGSDICCKSGNILEMVHEKDTVSCYYRLITCVCSGRHFPREPGQSAPPQFSFSTCSRKEPLIIRGTGLLWAGYPSCHPTNSVKALKETGNDTRPSEQCHFQWPWLTFMITHVVRAFSNAIFPTAAQQMTRFQSRQSIVQCIEIAELLV